MNGIGVGLTALLAVAFSGNPTDDDATLDNFRQQSATRLSSTPHIQSLPYALDPDCKNGRASVFDECSDQRVIFDAGLSLAKAEGKTLLVVYGAEWCIWVHVFNKYIRGQYGAFTHTFSSQWEQRWDTETLYEKRGDLAPIEANQLAEFVSQNFVVVFIEFNHSEGGVEVLERTGASKFYNYSSPFIFTVDSNGLFFKHFDNEGVETRRDTDDWFRGYDRHLLQERLGEMRAASTP